MPQRGDSADAERRSAPCPACAASPSSAGGLREKGGGGCRVRRDAMPAACSNGCSYSRAGHIFEKVTPEVEKLGYECKCLGGGKIDHNSKERKIRVFGLSTVSASLVFLQALLSLGFFSKVVV